MALTDDPNHPDLTHGVDDTPRDQAETYLVLSDEERAKGFTRPLRFSYTHLVCGQSTQMGQVLAETYARDPKFYGATYCVECRKYRPVGENGEFVWKDTDEKVGT